VLFRSIVGDPQSKLNAAKNALSVGNNITNAVKSGNLAASIADKITSGLPSIATSLTGIKNVPGLAGILESTKNVSAAAFAAITASFKSFKANVPVDLLEEAKNAEESTPVGPAANLAGKIPGIAINQLGSAASMASGVSNLPGGSQAVDAVINGAGQFAAQSTATVADATNTVRQLSTAATNNISAQAAETAKSNSLVGGVLGATNIGSKALDAVKGLSGLATTLAGNLAQNALRGLPPGIAATIQGAISSISSGGATNLKLPQVAEATNDRTGLETATVSLLGDPAIPPPNYGSQPNLSLSIESVRNKRAELKKQSEEIDRKFAAQKIVVLKLRDEFIEAKNNLPEGDPRLKEIHQAHTTAMMKWLDINDERLALAKSIG
jgi:hypothetical protein